MDIMKIPSKWNRVFRQEVTRLLSDRNIVDKYFSDLEKLHLCVNKELFDYGSDVGNYVGLENKLTIQMYETDEVFSETYYKFLYDLKIELGFDFYFQLTPTFRFHAPKLKNEDRFPEFHSDIGYGHPPQEINIWFSLTKNNHSNFYIIDKEKSNKWIDDYDSDYKKFTEVSYSSKYGVDKNFSGKGFSLAKEVESTIDDIFLFNSACIHTTVPRKEETKVSMDIRINPVEKFVDGYTGGGNMKAEFRPGGKFGYHRCSIGEIQ
jgi:hypothetical protein